MTTRIIDCPRSVDPEKPRVLKRYSIRVRGFDSAEVLAYTPSQARYKNFLAYDEAGYGPRGSKTLRFWDFVNRIEVFHHLGAFR